VNIDRAVYEGGIGPETATSTGDVSAIESVIGTFERRGRVKIANEARAELAALSAELAAKDAEIGRLRQVAQLAADMAGEDDGRALAAMAEMTAIVAKEALFGFPVDPHSPTPTGEQIERLQRAASRACDVMSECVTHSECSGADRAEMRAAEKALVDEILPPAPTDSVLVPRERLREIEWCAETRRHPNTDIESACPSCGKAQSLGHAPDCWLGNAIPENRV
jgi:hypothetical protein